MIGWFGWLFTAPALAMPMEGSFSGHYCLGDNLFMWYFNAELDVVSLVVVQGGCWTSGCEGDSCPYEPSGEPWITGQNGYNDFCSYGNANGEWEIRCEEGEYYLLPRPLTPGQPLPPAPAEYDPTGRWTVTAPPPLDLLHGETPSADQLERFSWAWRDWGGSTKVLDPSWVDDKTRFELFVELEAVK